MREVELRALTTDDLPELFEQHSDPEANRMAAFTVKDPSDRAAFLERWSWILANERGLARAVLLEGRLVGTVQSYEEEGRPEVTYWIAREHWGRGIATAALRAFLADWSPAVDVYARAAKDNVASLRVLEKCGFRAVAEMRGYAEARGAVVEEVLLIRSPDAEPGT